MDRRELRQNIGCRARQASSSKILGGAVGPARSWRQDTGQAPSMLSQDFADMTISDWARKGN